jgi:ABC-2 type transport system ATP-binding protein
MFCEYTAPATDDHLRTVVRRVGLEHAIHRRVGGYSCGMRQRLALAQALVPDPRLLILDEPGQGLDPIGFHELRRLLLELHERDGLSILLSSHLLAEVEQLCSHVTILKRGRMIFSGRWTESDDQRIVVRVDRQADAAAALTGAGLTEPFAQPDETALLPGRTLADAAEFLVARGFRIHALAPAARSLEAFYLRHDRAADGGAA